MSLALLGLWTEADALVGYGESGVFVLSIRHAHVSWEESDVLVLNLRGLYLGCGGYGESEVFVLDTRGIFKCPLEVVRYRFMGYPFDDETDSLSVILLLRPEGELRDVQVRVYVDSPENEVASSYGELDGDGDGDIDELSFAREVLVARVPVDRVWENHVLGVSRIVVGGGNIWVRASLRGFRCIMRSLVPGLTGSGLTDTVSIILQDIPSGSLSRTSLNS